MRSFGSSSLRPLVFFAPLALAVFALGPGAAGCGLSSAVDDVVQSGDNPSTTTGTGAGSTTTGGGGDTTTG